MVSAYAVPLTEDAILAYTSILPLISHRTELSKQFTLLESRLPRVRVVGGLCGEQQWSRCIWESPDQPYIIQCVAAAVNGTMYASGCFDTIQVWEEEDHATPRRPPIKVIDTDEDFTHTVLSIAFSFDGSLLAAGLDDGKVRLYDPKSGGISGRILEGHDDYVRVVVFNRGDFLASGSDDTTIRIWEISSRAARKRLVGHEGYIYSVAFAPDDVTLASGAGDNSIRLWNVKTGIMQKKITCSGVPSSLAFYHDGRYLAYGCDGSLAACSLEAEQSEPEVKPVQTGSVINSIAFSPDKATLASAHEDGSVRLWRLEFGKTAPFTQLELLKGLSDRGEVLSLTFLPATSTLLTGSLDGKVRLWDAASSSKRPQKRHVGGAPSIQTEDQRDREDRYLPRGGMQAISFLPDDVTVVVGTEWGTLQLWDTLNQFPVGDSIQAHTRTVCDIQLSPDHGTLASCSDDGTILLQEPTTKQPRGKVLEAHTDWVQRIAFSLDSRYLASCSYDGTACVWNTHTGEQRGPRLQGRSHSRLNAIGLSKDGSVVVGGDRDGWMTVWRTDSGNKLSESLVHDSAIAVIAFCPTQDLLASSSYDSTVRMWDLSVEGELKGRGEPFSGHVSGVGPIVFTSDGNWLVSGGFDGTIRLWDVTTREILISIEVPEGPTVYGISLSSDTQKMVTVTGDNMVRVWDVVAKQLQGLPLHGHTRGLRTIAFSNDDTLAATASSVGTIRIWALQSGKLKATINQIEATSFEGLGFSPNNGHIACRLQSKTILWELSLESDGLTEVSKPTEEQLEMFRFRTLPIASPARLNQSGWVEYQGQKKFWLPEEYGRDLWCWVSAGRLVIEKDEHITVIDMSDP